MSRRDEIEGGSGDDRIETLLEELPESAWSIPEPPPLREPATEPGRARERAGAGSRLAGWLRPVPLAGALAASLILGAAGLAAGLLLGDDASPANPVIVDGPEILATSELRGIEPSEPGARGSASVLAADDGARSVEVSVSGVRETGAGRYYEVWLMRGSDFVSLGSFGVGSSGARTVDLPLPVDPAAYRTYDISLERADGDPAHGAVSVLRGRA